MRDHLLNIDDLDPQAIVSLFSLAKAFKRQDMLVHQLKQQTIALCFWENSTRTRVSFEMAAHNLGLHSLFLFSKQSSSKKGESELDTLLTLYATGIRCCVIRHFKDRFYQDLQQLVPSDMVLINAGDGVSGHPSQGLLDAFSILEHKKKLDQLKVLFVGDVHHSRVVRSNVRVLQKFGAQCSAYITVKNVVEQHQIKGLPCVKNLDLALADTDVVMLLRAQDERWNGISPKEMQRGYLQEHGLNETRLKKLSHSTLIMHPGPFRRGVELCDAVLDDPRSIIWKQVENGVFVRMAILYSLLKEQV